MIRFLPLLSVSVALAAILISCQKKENPPPPPPSSMPMMPGQSPGMSGGMPGGMPGRTSPHANVTMPPAESMQTRIPDSVQGKWKGVVLTVVDRQYSNIKDHPAPLGGKLSLPESHLVIEVADFLPDFRIEGNVFTSSTNQPENPAVRVLIKENGQEVFKGWLFQKFPTMHPFQHQRYSITLKEGIPS